VAARARRRRAQGPGGTRPAVRSALNRAWNARAAVSRGADRVRQDTGVLRGGRSPFTVPRKFDEAKAAATDSLLLDYGWGYTSSSHRNLRSKT
jgi:hypothetical protein